MPDAAKAPNTRDILSIDFLHHRGCGMSPDVAFAGCRSGHIWTVDLRAPAEAWLGLRQNSGPCHLRSLDENHILTAGPSNTMCIFDLRWLVKDMEMAPSVTTRPPKEPPSHSKKRSREPPEQKSREEGRRANPMRSSTAPVLTFPGFKNNAQMHFGLDVWHEYNIVAVAEDNGKVALYSTKTGTRLQSPAVDNGVQANGTVRSLMFQTMPNDSHPSLFVGVGGDIKMFSWGLPRGRINEWAMP
jgi:hypothetical protein